MIYRLTLFYKNLFSSTTVGDVMLYLSNIILLKGGLAVFLSDLTKVLILETNIKLIALVARLL